MQQSPHQNYPRRRRNRQQNRPNNFNMNSVAQSLPTSPSGSHSTRTPGGGRKLVNILILGETGVGKSTFINAFANYLTYNGLTEANHGELICLIPTKFSVTQSDYTTKTVSFGSDKNENVVQDGSSQTQSCRAYVIKTPDKDIRVIDTPGIGDTRGVDQDRKNFDNILAFISHYPVLNGIVILLTPNNSRLSVSFRFCIQELLCHLHKSASDNIVFLFTNSRGTFYRPGDTLTPLKALLDEVRIKDATVNIQLNEKTIYCLDNESFRFLVAAQNGIHFTQGEKQNYFGSWKKSVQECRRLVERVAKIKPHETSDTISVNEARRMIVALSKPIGDITQNIQVNLELLEEQKKVIKGAGDDINVLKSQLYIPVVDLQPVFFDKPRTVCTGRQCTAVYRIGNVNKTDYVQVCHNPCYLKNIQKEVINNADLKGCSAMGGNGSLCSQCKHNCGWEKHMHIYYENKQVNKNKVDAQIEREISDKTKRTAYLKKLVSQLEQRMTVLEKEQKVITNISAHFAMFLKKNAITPYNDAVKDYLNHLIENEKNKCDRGLDSVGVLNRLKLMCQSYEAEVMVIQEGMSGAVASNVGNTVITADRMNLFIQELLRLEINGPVLGRMFQEFQDAKQREYQNFRESTFDTMSPRYRQ